MYDENEGKYRGEGKAPVTTACPKGRLRVNNSHYELSWKSDGSKKNTYLYHIYVPGARMCVLVVPLFSAPSCAGIVSLPCHVSCCSLLTCLYNLLRQFKSVLFASHWCFHPSNIHAALPVLALMPSPITETSCVVATRCRTRSMQGR